MIEATSPVRILRSRGSAILDVIEDHTDVGLAMLATFSRTLLDGAHAPPLLAHDSSDTLKAVKTVGSTRHEQQSQSSLALNVLN